MEKNRIKFSTAEGTAAMRAAHLLYHRPIVFNDPYAIRLISPAMRRVLRNPLLRWLLRREFISKSLRPVTAQVVSRAKYTEEKLELAVKKGIFQYVIISAGFDSFCLRRPNLPENIRVYEIDHPVTQQVKLKRIIDILGKVPEGIEFLAVDLEKTTIGEALSESSFVKNEKAFFSWLGSIPYISEDAVYNALGNLSEFAKNGSELIFDYSTSPKMWSQKDRQSLLRVTRIIDHFGEPVKSFLEPNILKDKLCNLGYSILEDVSPDELNKKYFSDRTDGLCAHSAAYIIHALINKIH